MSWAVRSPAMVCVNAVRAGVKGAVILDGRMPHACLLELFKDGGIGTLIKA